MRRFPADTLDTLQGFHLCSPLGVSGRKCYGVHFVSVLTLQALCPNLQCTSVAEALITDLWFGRSRGLVLTPSSLYFLVWVAPSALNLS